MALITNIKDLEKYTLKLYDHVEFRIDGEVLGYEVNNDHLMGIGIPNNKIFEMLGISPLGRRCEFASSIYGYLTNGGSWPASKEGDYMSLTRLVKALYEQIENKKKSPFKPLEITKIDQPQDPQAESKITIPKTKIKYIKGEVNSKLKLIK
jgi:hypothetical protein